MIIFAFQTCFAQKASTSVVPFVNPDLQAVRLVYKVVNDFPDLESMINFIGVAINKVDQLSALKSKIGIGNLKSKISQIKLENNVLIYGTDKISVKNGKVYFNQMEISFDPKLSLAENYELVLSSLKKYKDQNKSALFSLLIPNVYADNLNYENIAKVLAVLAVVGLLSGLTALYLVASGASTFAAQAVSTSLWTALAISVGLNLASGRVQASTFLQNNKDICRSKGSNNFSNSYLDKDGILHETSLTLKDGFLVITSTSNNKHKKTLVLEPNSNRVINEYDENKKLIPSDKFTKVTKEEVESLFSIYKVCADPELRKEFKAKINEYAKIQNSGQAKQSAQPKVDPVKANN